MVAAILERARALPLYVDFNVAAARDVESRATSIFCTYPVDEFNGWEIILKHYFKKQYIYNNKLLIVFYL